ncbi:MAG TPA: TonB-dependent receptor plug domain-containing protein, partial [Flavobacteriaceae bacterium]|nr:TonB-dependent receptor plug domain-containing protein [Flavobacteriaceae bacterium]
IHSYSGDSNEFEFDDDEEDVKVHIVDTKKGKKIHTVASNNKVFHLDSDEDIVIIKKDKDGNIVKEKIIKSEDEDVLIVGDDNSFKVKSIGKGDNKFFFVGEGEGDPLIIIDGNEASEEEMKKLDPDEIEKMEVLKGNSATKEYGEKGENGVVLITTK